MPKVNILLVDDQPANLLALEAVLDGLGENLVKAHSGEEALRLADQEVAVILLDVQMRGLDGYETAKLIRSREQTRHTPIIFLTAYDENRLSVEAAYALGAVDYLVKPLVPVILRAKVAGFVELFKKTQQIKHQAEQLRQLERREFAQRLAEENGRLRQQKELFRTTLASIGDAVITTDMEGRVTYLNAVAESLTGWTQQAAAGQPLDTVFHIVNEQTRQPVENPVKKVLIEGKIAGMANHTLLVAKDGTERPIDDSAAPIQDEQGNVAGLVLIFRDITERKRGEDALRESERRFREMVDALPAAIYTTDADGRLTHFNPVATEFFGRTPELGTDRWCMSWKLYHPDGSPMPHEECPMAFALKEGRTVRGAEAIAERPDGKRIWLTPYPTAMRDVEGRVVGGINMVVDISERKRAEMVTASLAAIVESSDDAIVTKDLNGVITSWNQGAERLFGYTAQEAIGQPITMLIPADRSQEEPEILARLRRGERVDHFETVRVRKDGTRLEISLTISPLKDSAGRIIGASKIARDITERKRAEEALRESEARFRMLADNISQLAWTCDSFGSVTWYNQRWLDYTGLSFDDMKGWNWSKVQHPDHLKRVVERVRRSAETGEPWEDTFPLRGKDGQYRWFLSRAVPIRDEAGEIVCWFGTNTDVTEQRAAEEGLKEADCRKNEFLAMLAHELRNPLAPIRNAVQILRLAGADMQAVHSASELMERQVGHMVRMVDDLLDVNRISRGKIELRRGRIELASAVNPAVEAARALYKSMNHELTVKLPPQPIYLNADPTRLAQVMGNLLNNACKFTNPGGRIWLTVEQEGESAVIRVRDTGIGIAAEQLPRIFEMFMQVDTSLERSVSGLGVGLSLVKNLVELHGGTVEVHSAGLGQGSEFVVRLPVLTAPPQPPPARIFREPTLTRARHILVVDDNRDSATSLAMLLKLTGNVTHTAYDGLEAVEAAATFRPDVVLLDIGLPKLNGYEACRRIREQPWGKDMVLIALTGWGQEEDRQQSREAGFNSHLVKPVDLDALRELLLRSEPVATSACQA